MEIQDVRDARSGLITATQPARYYLQYRLKTKVSQDDCEDGLANTVLLGESVFDSDDFIPPSGNEEAKSIDHWCFGSPQNDFGFDMSEFLGSTAVPINLYHQYSDERLNSETIAGRAELFREMSFGFASWHAGNVVNFAMGDGAVRTVEAKIDANLLRNLGNRDDGALIDEAF